MTFNAINVCKGTFKDTCLNAVATKYTQSGDQHVFVNTGVYLFRDEAIKFLESHFASTIEPRAKQWQQPWGIDWGREPMIGKLTGLRHPTMDNMVSAESKASQILNYVCGLYRALQSLRADDDARLASSITLEYKCPEGGDTNCDCDSCDIRREDHRIERYRRNEWLMNELATNRHLENVLSGAIRSSTPIRKVENGVVVKTYEISAAAMRCLQPDIEEKRWNMRVDEAALRRLQKEKEDLERQRFEDAVQKRMQELKRM